MEVLQVKFATPVRFQNVNRTFMAKESSYLMSYVDDYLKLTCNKTAEVVFVFSTNIAYLKVDDSVPSEKKTNKVILRKKGAKR